MEQNQQLWDLGLLKKDITNIDAVKLSQNARDILQDWLWADQMLYDQTIRQTRKKKKYLWSTYTEEQNGAIG